MGGGRGLPWWWWAYGVALVIEALSNLVDALGSAADTPLGKAIGFVSAVVFLVLVISNQARRPVIAAARVIARATRHVLGVVWRAMRAAARAVGQFLPRIHVDVRFSEPKRSVASALRVWWRGQHWW